MRCAKEPGGSRRCVGEDWKVCGMLKMFLQCLRAVMASAGASWLHILDVGFSLQPTHGVGFEL